MSGAMTLQAKIVNPDTGQSKDADFRIDTGADISAICLYYAEDLALKPKRFTVVSDADGEPLDVPVFVVDLALSGCYLRNVEVIGLDLSRSNCAGLIGDNVLDKGILVRDGNSWSFTIRENVCAAGTVGAETCLLVFGLVLGMAVTLLLTRK